VVGSGEDALLYGAIGLFHYIFRRKSCSSPWTRGGEAQGISTRFWDFVFYASFGFVVTSSVAIAGVLLVFCSDRALGGRMLYSEHIGNGWQLAGPWARCLGTGRLPVAKIDCRPAPPSSAPSRSC